ncbi:MAG: 4-coumarate--CoA ligase family protein [Chloroflexi bacterium]|jgi:acyl-CoA synthetase (AMP-forming)/AMP-acid ligase II|nr:4-coumarate--CoA ligase family protein [Chloroflexota bacterium]
MIFRSSFPDITIPELTFTDFTLQKAAERLTQPALIDGPSGRTLTYGQLLEYIRRVGANLHARGFKKGDVLAILLPNLPEYAAAFHGAASIGGVLTTINPLYTAEELTFQLSDTRAKYLLTLPMFIEKAIEGAKNTSIEEIFVLGEAPGATPFAALLQPADSAPPVNIDVHRDLLVIPYSSGTTGLPKGVMLTHNNVVSFVSMIRVAAGYHPGQKYLAVLPFFHIFGMVGIMGNCLVAGATMVTMPRFDLEQFLQLIQDHKIAGACLVPPIVLALAKHPIVDKYDLSSLEWLLSGAAPLSADLQKACAARLNCAVVQGWGMTETSCGASIVPLDQAGKRPGAAGMLIPNQEYRVVDYTTGEDQGPGHQGEIWLRGPNIMQGYLNQPQATADTINSEGWLYTGDIGYIDEEGYLFIVDRIKELIKYKGLQIAPAELEAVLLSHPAVADAAVIGRADEEAGEVPKAFVVLKSPVNAEELLAFVSEKVAPYKRIRKLEIIDQIPKSASGKILRRVLVAKERELEKEIIQ